MLSSVTSSKKLEKKLTKEEFVEAILEVSRLLDEPKQGTITLDLSKPEDQYFFLGMSGYLNGTNY